MLFSGPMVPLQSSISPLFLYFFFPLLYMLLQTSYLHPIYWYVNILESLPYTFPILYMPYPHAPYKVSPNTPSLSHPFHFLSSPIRPFTRPLHAPFIPYPWPAHVLYPDTHSSYNPSHHALPITSFPYPFLSYTCPYTFLTCSIHSLSMTYPRPMLIHTHPSVFLTTSFLSYPLHFLSSPTNAPSHALYIQLW